jgi:hypothetical protein
VLQHVIALFRRQDVVVCDRCGWRGRLSRVRTEPGRHLQQRKATASSASTPVDLAALDQAFDGTRASKERR